MLGFFISDVKSLTELLCDDANPRISIGHSLLLINLELVILNLVS